MNKQLSTQGYFLDQYIIEQSNECVRFRIPANCDILIDEAELKKQFEDIRYIDKGIFSNGDYYVTIWLKQYQPSYDGEIMHYR